MKTEPPQKVQGKKPPMVRPPPPLVLALAGVAGKGARPTIPPQPGVRAGQPLNLRFESSAPRRHPPQIPPPHPAHRLPPPPAPAAPKHPHPKKAGSILPPPPKPHLGKPGLGKPPPRAPQVAAGRYRILKVLGDGGTSTVYRADDGLLGMPVAIKLLKREFREDAAALSQLKEEARIALHLAHSHIVRLYDMQKVGNQYALIMEFVDGQSLRHILDRYGRLALDSVLDIVGVCTEALAYAHRKGVLHNDLKPDNLLLTREGVLKVVDFGTASFMHKGPGEEYIVGTPAYMSPEQRSGQPLDTRTDVYALGITVYELLTGRTPFPRRATFDQILAMKPEPLTGVPDAVREVLEKAMAADRADRWNSIEEFRDALFRAAGRTVAAG